MVNNPFILYGYESEKYFPERTVCHHIATVLLHDGDDCTVILSAPSAFLSLPRDGHVF